MRKLTILFFALLLAACGGGGGDNGAATTAAVRIKCSSVFNDGSPDVCQGSVSAFSEHPAVSADVTQVDLGTVSRTGTVNTDTSGTNTTAVAFHGSLHVVYKMDCKDGTGQFPGFDAGVTADPGQPWRVAQGYGCSAADPGNYDADITLFDQDGMTVIDQWLGHYTLTE